MGHPPALLIVAITIVAAVTTIGFWVSWLPIAWRAVKTGRLLAKGVVYDKDSTPVRYWTGLNGMLAVGLIMIVATGMLIAGAIARM